MNNISMSGISGGLCGNFRDLNSGTRWVATDRGETNLATTFAAGDIACIVAQDDVLTVWLLDEFHRTTHEGDILVGLNFGVSILIVSCPHPSLFVRWLHERSSVRVEG